MESRDGVGALRAVPRAPHRLLGLAARFVFGAALALIAWGVPFPSLLAAFPLFLYQRSRSAVFVGLLGYYGAVSIEVPGAVARYFHGELPAGSGWLVWAIDATLLSGEWVAVVWLLDLLIARGRRASAPVGSPMTLPFRWPDSLFWMRWPLGNLVVSFGPLGFLHWADPWFGAGLWFPGGGVTGALLYLFVLPCLYALASLPNRWSTPVATLLGAVLLSLGILRGMAMPQADRSVLAWRTEGGEIDYLNTVPRVHLLQSVADELLRSKETLLILPESYLGDYRSSIDAALFGRADALARAGKTLLVGVDVLRTDGYYDDALVAYGADTGIVYRAITPMPLSWLSRSRPRNRGSGGEAIVSIGGKPTLFALCYETLLFSHGLLATMNSDVPPARILASSNLWAFPNEGISMQVQRQSLFLLSRILGIPVEWSYNFSPFNSE